MGPVSASMIDRVTLEASNPNNPELGWKTVTKGKRSKKLVGKNVNEITKVSNISPKKIDGTASRKLVSKGPDHIPPKKRRGPLLHSSPLGASGPQPNTKEDPLSPQPQTSSPHGDSKPQTTGFCKSSAINSKVDSAGFSGDLKQKLYNPEDFSGIALLAAAACIEGIDETSHFNLIEQHPIPEKATMSASRAPIKCSISIEPESSLSDMVKEPFDAKCSSVGASVSQSKQVNEDVAVRELEATKVDRLYWDLNTVMDAWGESLDDSAGVAPSVDVRDPSLEVNKLEGEGCDALVKSDYYHITENSRPLVQIEQINSEPANNTDKASRGISVLDVCPAKAMIGAASGNISVVHETAEVGNETTPSSNEKDCMQHIELSVRESSQHESNMNNVAITFAEKTSYLPDNSGFYSPTPNDKCVSTSGAPALSTFCTPKGQTNSITIPDNTVIEGTSLPFPSTKNDASPTTPSYNLISCSAKVGSSLDDCRLEVSQRGGNDTVGSKDMTGLQDGNDSPYEDGELRMSITCPWEENEFDYGDTECVDYESDGADYPGSEVVEAGSDDSVEKQSLSVREGSISELNPSGSLKTYMKEEVEVGGIISKSCARIGYYMRDNNLGRRHSSYLLGGIETKGSNLEEMQSRTNRVKSDSIGEGSGYMDVMENTNTGYLQQNNRSRFYSRPIRDGNPGKFMGRQRSPMGRQRSPFHVRERNLDDDQWGEHWGSKSHMTSGYHGPAGPKYYRPRNMTADFEKFSGLNSQDNRQSTYYSSKAPYQADNRRSSYEMDDYYRVERTPSNTDRSRGNPGNYLQGVSRGNRHECYEPSREKHTFSSSRIPRYLSRRELSHSPPSGRVSQSGITRNRSRSRSRSRSPSGGRRYTRPNFKSDARVDRVRMPFQKPSFPVDHSGSARSRFSPQRNSRWVDDRNFVENLRHRRSPVSASERIFRYNSIGSDGSRYKEDNYYRPGNRPGRFPPVGGAGRGCNFGKKYDDRRDGLHRTRHLDANVDIGYKHDPEDNFDGNITRKDDVRNTEHRYVARNSHEDRRSFEV